MVSDEVGVELHERATRGEQLSAEEQAQLEAWYAAQDEAEADLLGSSEVQEIASLESQVENAAVQLSSVTARIQQVMAENQALRREVAALRKQLAEPA